MYNPLGVSLHAAQPIHFDGLATVAEGWFVEYKRQMTQAKEISKEVAAFANTRGGWLFVGLDEKPGERTPSGGPGVLLAEAGKVSDSLRDAIHHHISPVPDFEIKVTPGPIPALAIPEGFALVTCFIPQSSTAPHVHSSSRVYVRVSDKSTPQELSDRTALDELYARSASGLKSLNQELDRLWSNMAARDRAAPFIHVAIVPRFVDSGHTPDMVSYADFASAIDNAGGVELPDRHSTDLGFAATNRRQQNRFGGDALEIEYSLSGSIYLTAPLSYAAVLRESVETSPPDMPPFMTTEHANRFADILADLRFDAIDVVDLTHLASILLSVELIAQSLWRLHADPAKFFVRIRAFNMAGRSPFFASTTYLDFVSTNGLPRYSRDTMTIPGHDKQIWLCDNPMSQFPLVNLLTETVESLGGPPSGDSADVVLETGRSFAQVSEKAT